MQDWKKVKAELIKSFHKLLPPADRKPDREFKSPQGYLDHEYLYCLKQMAFFEIEKNEIWRGLAYTCLGIDDLKIDPYYISKDILSHLANTELPDLSHPFQEATPFLEVVLPTGELLDDEGDSIVMLIVVDYYLWREMAQDDRLKKVWEGTEKSYRYGVYGLCEHGAVFYAPILSEKDLNPVAQGEVVISGGRVDDVLQTVRSIGLNLLILVQEYPDYITIKPSPPCISGPGFGKAKKTKKPVLRSPRIIGSDFNVKYDLEDHQSQISVISSPAHSVGKRPHFRRGHWRRQRKGDRLKEHQYIWIKPKLINHITE